MTTTDRDQLADILDIALNQIRAFDDAGLWKLADALLAAGVTLPRRIETVEELDALPDECLIRATGTYISGDGAFVDCWAFPVPRYISGPVADRHWWVPVHGGEWLPSLTSSSRIESATVLWTPGGAQ